jgi:Patatin-like phospholipase
MRDDSATSSSTNEQRTLGRLGGLAPGEADRGEKVLWLSGGGYRAALFHLGALTRLNELGVLAQTGTVGAVSGGSIVAALLATGVAWPLDGGYREWPERVAEPLRAIARRNARARAFLRKPFPAARGGAVLEERYARELVDSLGGEPARGPRFVFGASGLILSGLAAGWEECIEWDLSSAAHPPGYEPGLVAEVIAAVRTDLDAFGEAEQAVLENHGYLLADAAARERGLVATKGIEPGPPEPPHPRWMSEKRVRKALGGSARRTPVGRLRPRRASRAGRFPQPGSPELAALLARHRPLLQYDSLESFRADSVATICGLIAPGRCNSLHRADGALIAAAAPGQGEARLELDFLRGTSYPNGEPVRESDYLDECGGSHVADALAMRQQEGHADVAYGRARHDEEGRLWLQYWFFYYYDDKGLLGLERHEGDWEMVQLRLDAGMAPEAATFARHAGAERLSWDEVELADSGEGPALVVYPARGSHASLPRAGRFEAPVVPDHNDGLGPRLRPELTAIADDGPSWVLWPGRWGATRRREFFEADSPRGPREQPQWWDPAELHREAQPGGGTAASGGDPAPRPRLEARREGDLAVVSYRFDDPAPGAGEPARFLIAPFSNHGDAPSAAHSLPIEGRAGSLAMPLPDGRDWAGVRASVVSDRGVPGGTIAVTFE